MEKRHFLFLAALVGIVVLAVFSFNHAEKSNAVRIGYLPISADLDFFVAADQGFFEKRGVSIEAIKFESSVDALNALSAGQLDATSTVGMETVFSSQLRSTGTIKLILATVLDNETEVHKIVVLDNSSIRTIGDLQGKKIGVLPGGNMRTLVRLSLDKNINASTLIFVELPSVLQVTALSAGSVDALATIEPVGTIAQAKLGARVIETNFIAKRLFSPMSISASTMSRKFYAKNPDASAKVFAAFEEAAAFIREHPSEAKKSFVKWLRMDEKLAQKIGVYRYVPAKRVNGENLQKFANILQENKVIAGKVNATELLQT